MGDVVLHYRPVGSAAVLGSVLQTTGNVLESFPVRPTPVFTSWFPHTADTHLPITPARPAPVITHWTNSLDFNSPPLNPFQEPKDDAVCAPSCCEHTVEQDQENGPAVGAEKLPKTPRTSPAKNMDVLSASPLIKPDTHINTASPGKHSLRESPVKRSWNVFTQSSGIQTQRSHWLSGPFRHMVSTHRLHPRQRARWVIAHGNCGTNGDIEQVWLCLSRCVRSSMLPQCHTNTHSELTMLPPCNTHTHSELTVLPPCNANIQRERSEIWVFCDLLQAEQVGLYLKKELRLAGRISLSVHRLGKVFSM